MLKQTSIPQIREGKITRDDGYLVACMAFYPRGMSKKLIDEFRNNLAPDRELFAAWKAEEEKSGHNEAFAVVDYESRFLVKPEGLESLRRLIDVARTKDVYLACQCDLGQRCHRELLLITARDVLKAEVGEIYNSYPAYEARLAKK